MMKIVIIFISSPYQDIRNKVKFYQFFSK